MPYSGRPACDIDGFSVPVSAFSASVDSVTVVASILAYKNAFTGSDHNDTLFATNRRNTFFDGLCKHHSNGGDHNDNFRGYGGDGAGGAGIALFLEGTAGGIVRCGSEIDTLNALMITSGVRMNLGGPLSSLNCLCLGAH